MTGVMEESACSVEMLVNQITRTRTQTTPRRALLIAISGIAGSGKGHVARRLEAELTSFGYRVATISADDWRNLPHIRFDAKESGVHYYQHALRFDEMFATLIRPLRDSRAVRVETDFADESATAYRRRTYEFDDVDIILLEGNFLLKWEFFPLYDLSIWADCTFTTALDRAIRRSPESMPADATIAAYHATYFPAQRMHMQLDDPKRAATFVLCNDALLDEEIASAHCSV